MRTILKSFVMVKKSDFREPSVVGLGFLPYAGPVDLLNFHKELDIWVSDKLSADTAARRSSPLLHFPKVSKNLVTEYQNAGISVS